MMDENYKKKSGDSESDPSLTPPKKKIKNYEHKLSNKLLNDERFSAWIEVSKKNHNRAFCKYCNC